MVPLAGHPGAEPAALAYLCTPEPLRDQMADKLFKADSANLTPDGTLRLALGLDVDPVKFTGCLVAADTKAILEADKKLFDELGGKGLPFTFVGKRIVLGAQADKLKEAVAREFEGAHLSLPIWAMFVLIATAFVTAIGLTVRAEGKESPKEATS